MLFQIAEKFLSPTRLQPYKEAMKGNEALTLSLYIDNLRVAQSFYPSLSILEVALRNSIHNSLAKEFRSSNWLLEQQTGFMIDRRLTYFNKGGKEIINRKALNMMTAAINEFKEQRQYVPSVDSSIIAELPFGFWTTLFNKKYFDILNRAPLDAFPARPRGTGWGVINDKITNIRVFRNRIYHYEPLCFHKTATTALDFRRLYEVHGDITDLLAWISPDMAQWLKGIDLVPEKLKNLQKKYPDAT